MSNTRDPLMTAFKRLPAPVSTVVERPGRKSLGSEAAAAFGRAGSWEDTGEHLWRLGFGACLEAHSSGAKINRPDRNELAKRLWVAIHPYGAKYESLSSDTREQMERGADFVLSIWPSPSEDVASLHDRLIDTERQLREAREMLEKGGVRPEPEEPRGCASCRFVHLVEYQEPCARCDNYFYWEKAT